MTLCPFVRVSSAGVRVGPGCRNGSTANLRAPLRPPPATSPFPPGAFEEARKRDVPVLLSVWYASSHWCQCSRKPSSPRTSRLSEARGDTNVEQKRTAS
ncbi:thioredoxin domain-containing protein [Streptomyces anulatus]